MNTLHNSNKFRELFFLITPSNQIIKDVSNLKSDVQKVLGHSFDSVNSIAHLSLYQDVKVEADIMRSLYGIQSRLQSITPFNVIVKNLNIFRHGSRGSIFLEVVNKSPVCDVFERLLNKKISFKPHITIGRNLSSEDFVKAWSSLKNRKYSQHFLCNRITVLTRSANRWVDYVNIPFGE